MALRKPFRAVPINLGPRYRRKHRLDAVRSAFRYLCVATIGGAIIGVGSAAFTDGGRATILITIRPVAVLTGVVRARDPQTTGEGAMKPEQRERRPSILASLAIAKGWTATTMG